MIARYSRPAMSDIWSQRRKYEYWLRVELAACEVMEEQGRVPKGIAARVRKNVTIDPTRIDEIEQVVKHDIIAFLESITEQAGKDARHLHTGVDILRCS